MHQPPAYTASELVDAPRAEPSVAPVHAAAPSDLPDYASVPTLRAERLFWAGFICPLLWLIGASRLIGLGREDPLRAAGFGRGKHGSPSPEEAGITDEAVWRYAREERKWARRSCRALIAVTLLAGLIALLVVFFVVVQRRLRETSAPSPSPVTVLTSAADILTTSAIRATPTGPPGGALRGFVSS